MRKHFAALSVLAVLLTGSCVLAQEQNLITNPSFEEFDQKALDKKDEKAFSGWIYHVWEGHCELRAGNVAHSGKTSAVMVGGVASKQRIWQEHELEAGRYRITAYIRGLNVGKGNWGTTTEFMFDGTDDGKGYFQLEKNGNFGWTKLTYVADIKAKHKVKGPSFGSWAPGYFWVDDVTLEKVGNDVPMTEKPVLDKEETPLAPPGKLDGTAVHCPDCGSRNMPGWKTCYACGWNMATRKPAPEELAGSPVKLITDFSNDNPFTQGDGSDKATLVPEHAAQGKKAIRLDQLWAVMRANQDWTGYDFLKADVYTDAK